MNDVKVQSTSDYKVFKVMGANRMVNKGHVQQLINSIEEKPDAIKYSPILVNKNMYVIDGQHRLQALMELKMPVTFIVGDILTIEDARRMNASMMNWSPMDYARSYSDGGNKNYTHYIRARRDFKTNHTVTAHFLSNDFSPYTSASWFKRGKFTVSDLEMALHNLELLVKLQQMTKFGNYKNFGLAFMKVLNNENVDMDRFFKKFGEVGNQYINSPQATMNDYLRQFEMIYNHGLIPKNQVRMF